MLWASACTTPTPLAPACRDWQAGDDRSAPPTHCFFFPSSVALDPLGDILYVANHNSDTSFRGATVVTVDLLRHERATQCFRKYRHDPIDASDVQGKNECGDALCSASGAALGPTANLQSMELVEAVTGRPPADFDRCYCEWDLDDPNIVNCESQRFILADQTVMIGNEPEDMRILAEDPPDWTTAGNAPLHRGLYLTVRGDPSITFIDATRPLSIGRTGKDSPAVHMDCGGDAQPFAPHEPGQPYNLHLCGVANVVQQTADSVLIDPDDPNAGSRPRYTVPPEPLELRIDRGCVEPGVSHARGQNPPCKSGEFYQYLVASHLASGQVSAYNLGKSPTLPEPPVLQDVSALPLPPGDSAGRRGAYALAPRLPGDLSQPWYVVSRMTGAIASFRLATAAGPRVVPGLGLSINNQFSLPNDDIRDIVFEPGGNRAFIALRSPPALAMLDTSLRSGIPVNQVQGVVNLCLGPLHVARALIPRSFMSSTIRTTRLYVTCNLSGQVAEIDGDSGDLLDIISIGRSPGDIALNFGQANGGTDMDPCVDPYVSDADAKTAGVTCPPAGPKTDLRLRPFGQDPALGPRAYISALYDNSIAVLDIDPRSPSFRRVISRIGFPLPKQVQ